MKKPLLIFAMQIWIFVLFSCNTVNDKNKPQSIDKVLTEQKAFLIGQDLHSVIEITGGIACSTNVCLFIYSSNDCDACLRQGFKIINYLDSTMVNLKIYVITSSVNIGNEQLRYGYKDYVYFDEHDALRRKLKYITTPIFLFLDSAMRITDVFHPGNYQESDNLTQFFNLFNGTALF